MTDRSAHGTTADRAVGRQGAAAVLGLAGIILAAGCVTPSGSGQQQPAPSPTPTLDIDRFTLRAPRIDHTSMGPVSYTKITGSLECLPSNRVAITLEAQQPRDDLLVTLLSGRWNPLPVQGCQDAHADLRGDEPWRRVTQALPCHNAGSHYSISIEVTSAADDNRGAV